MDTSGLNKDLLQMAFIKDNLDLYKKEAPLDLSKYEFDYCFGWAIHYKAKKIVEYIISNSKDKVALTPHFYGSFSDDQEFLIKIFFSGNLSVDGLNYQFSQACYYGHSDIVKILLEDNRVNPAHNSSNAFKNALKEGHDDVLEILFDDGRTDFAHCYETTQYYKSNIHPTTWKKLELRAKWPKLVDKVSQEELDKYSDWDFLEFKRT